jgi:hypothetical protein
MIKKTVADGDHNGSRKITKLKLVLDGYVIVVFVVKRRSA